MFEIVNTCNLRQSFAYIVQYKIRNLAVQLNNRNFVILCTNKYFYCRRVCVCAVALGNMLYHKFSVITYLKCAVVTGYIGVDLI